ncbi:MAG TPA: (2Fe-2S)-binding protein [Humibacillus xanthopallidus]|nr:(2Fe-2S)-binding protein [Humibacillus xanthopallidus]
MSEPVPHAAALALLARIDRALPFTSVVTTGSAATVWCADVVARARAGGDPLRPWRDALQAQQERMHGVAVPPHVPAAFVLQWWCEVVATPLAYAVRLGEGVVVPDPGGLGFELAPGLHPHRIVVDPDRLTRLSPPAVEGDATGGGAAPGAGAEVALGLARTAYLGLVEDVVRDFAPDVVMGSRQRWGVVEDVWLTAVRQADGAAGVAVGPAPRRVSCCFIYVLPGMRECASCPRGGRG